jgi:hypothetical protein
LVLHQKMQPQTASITDVKCQQRICHDNLVALIWGMIGRRIQIVSQNSSVRGGAEIVLQYPNPVLRGKLQKEAFHGTELYRPLAAGSLGSCGADQAQETPCQ